MAKQNKISCAQLKQLLAMKAITYLDAQKLIRAGAVPRCHGVEKRSGSRWVRRGHGYASSMNGRRRR